MFCDRARALQAGKRYMLDSLLPEVRTLPIASGCASQQRRCLSARDDRRSALRRTSVACSNARASRNTSRSRARAAHDLEPDRQARPARTRTAR